MEHFDAYTLVYDHTPAAVEIKGSIVSQEIISKIPRLDKRWIASIVSKELQQAVDYASQQPVPHWSMNQHEHRQELTKIVHEATQGVKTTKVKPRKPNVTADILEVSAHRDRLIKSKHREEQQTKRLVRKMIFSLA